MTICNDKILLNLLDTNLNGPQIVCAEKPYEYTARAFRQCYNTGCIPISRYVWVINDWEPYNIINTDNEDINYNSISFPSSGTYILSVSAIDEENNIDVAQLAISSYNCLEPYAIIETQSKYCTNTPSIFLAKLNQLCNPTACVSAVNYTWYINSSAISSIDVSNVNTNVFSYTFTEAGPYSIKVEVTTEEDFACIIKPDILTYETNICIANCTLQPSAHLIAKNNTSQISACTGETIAFMVTTNLQCDPICAPVSAYSWRIDNNTINVYTNNVYDIQTYSYSSTPIADVVSVTAFDISGNTATKNLNVDVDNNYCTYNIKNLELQLAGPPFICINTTNSLTYSAFATPFYYLGSATTISAYKWNAYNSFNQQITSFQIATTSLSSTLTIKNISEPFTVQCQLFDISGRSIIRSTNIISKDCNGLLNDQFYITYNGNFNPCSGTQQQYTVSIENRNTCDIPIIKQYTWSYNNTSTIRSINKSTLSDSITLTASLMTSSIYISAITVDDKIAKTYFTIKPINCSTNPTIATLTLTGPSAINCVPTTTTRPPDLPTEQCPITQDTYFYFIVDDSSGWNSSNVMTMINTYIKSQLQIFYKTETDFNNHVYVVDNSSERCLRWIGVEGNEYLSTCCANKQRWKTINATSWSAYGATLLIPKDASNIIVFTFSNEGFDNGGPARYHNNNGAPVINTTPQNNYSGQYFVDDVTYIKNKWNSYPKQNFIRAARICFSNAYKAFVDTTTTDNIFYNQNSNYSLKDLYDQKLIYVSPQLSETANSLTIYNNAIVPALERFGIFSSTQKEVLTVPCTQIPQDLITNNTYIYFFLDNSASMNVHQNVMSQLITLLENNISRYYNSKEEYRNKVKVIRSVTERAFNWMTIDYSKTGFGESNTPQENNYPQDNLTSPAAGTIDNNNVIVFVIQNEARCSNTCYYHTESGKKGKPYRVNDNDYIDEVNSLVAPSTCNKWNKSYFTTDFIRFKNWLTDKLNKNQKYYRACIIPIRDNADDLYRKFMQTVIENQDWYIKNPNYSLYEYRDKISVRPNSSGKGFAAGLIDASHAAAGATTIFNQAIAPALRSFGVPVADA